MADETRYNARDDRAAPRRAAGRRFASRRALPALLTVALLLALIPLAAFAASPAPTANRASEAAAQQSQGAFTSFDDAGDSRDLGAMNPKDYMTVSLTLAQQSFVRVSFTGYAYAKSSAAGVQTPGCPCLVRGELRVNNESRQIVTRTVLATEGDDVAGDPNATPAVAAADRRDLSGSHVYELAAGIYTFTMSMRREVGTADNIGFAFGRMQAQVLSAGAPAPAQPTPAATVPAQPTATMAATATPRPQPTATTAPVPTATMVMPGLPATGAGASSAAVATDRSRGLLASLALVAVVVGVAFALRRRMA